MAEIMDQAKISKKWATVTPQRDQFYKEGVENPRRPWADSAFKGEENYKRSVTEAANQGRFGKGIRKVGEAKWKNRSSELGPGRFREGVQVAEADHLQGFAPYYETFKALRLPERFPKGDPRNYKRNEAVGTSYHTKKLSLLGVK